MRLENREIKQRFISPISSASEIVKDFQKALALESERKKGKKLPPKCLIQEKLYYSERVKYVEQINRFYKYFSREQIKIIIYDDWQKDNEKIYQEILYFLGVESKFMPTIQTYNKGGKKVKIKWIQELLLDLRLGRKSWLPIKHLFTLILPDKEMRNKIFSLINDKLIYSSVKPITPQLKQELKQAFKPEIIALSRLIHRDLLKLWNY